MKRSHRTLGIVRVAARLLSILGLLASVPAQAALLGLDALLEPNPDLFSPYLTVQYTASSDAFTVDGNTSLYYEPDGNGPWDVMTTGSPPFGTLGTFSLSAVVDGSGSLVSGTVTISGKIDDLSIPYGVLLQGDLTQFGFEDGATDKFDFLFSVTGGALASAYGPVAGTVLNTEDVSFTDFSSDFSTSGDGVADTRMMIPEPSTGLLVTFSVLVLGWIVRRVPLRKC